MRLRIPTIPEAVVTRHQAKAWPLGVSGVALLVIGSLMSWSYDPTILGNLSLMLNPGGLQIIAIVLAALAMVLLLGHRNRLGGLGRWLDMALGLRALATWTLGYMVLALLAIAVEADGLINVDPGGWISFAGSVLLYLASRLAVPAELGDLAAAVLPGWLEIGSIAVTLGLVLFGAAYALGRDDAWEFGLFLAAATAVVLAALRSGLITWFGHVGQRHRHVLTLAAFVVAFLFPFTQGGSAANMSIATQVLIFAATAIGLNIVVGLAGLLDLGYIAFLGSGAYVAASLSHSAFATIDVNPPFLVVALIGAVVAGTFGLIIGTPTLRVSGDYLAIVTLGFGEIFRLSMFNLDGNNGPNLTNGPNGIPGIPDLSLFGFDFGASHTLLGFTLDRFSNYYFILLVFIAFVILVFVRLNDSRIGRGWVAIREDEKAAEAMGVNTFGLKLLAFATGASLAGIAGTIKAHHDVSVTPDQYVFLESAFLLAAVVLGGMGTIAGVLIGATLLKVLPEKLRFFNDYRLMLFGLTLVLMMRFRPEGLIASRRRQLEFHAEDEELAVSSEHEIAEEAT